MKLVIALGGNALLQRGEPQEAALQLKNVALAAQSIAEVAEQHDVVICHGNGPQVGLLALQNAAYDKVTPYPLDILGAESQGMIGYMLQQALKNQLPQKKIVTLLTQVEVDIHDPAFQEPTKFVGPVYQEAEAKTVERKMGWKMAKDGNYYRRVVPSPSPERIIEAATINTLLENDTLMIVGGGGGIPVVRDKNHQLKGVEAVIDKDSTAALIAKSINADGLIILTDVDAVYNNWGEENQTPIKQIDAASLEKLRFPAGSMGPKIKAACDFVNAGGQLAGIGNLTKALQIIEEKAGTLITKKIEEE